MRGAPVRLGAVLPVLLLLSGLAACGGGEGAGDAATVQGGEAAEDDGAAAPASGGVAAAATGESLVTVRRSALELAGLSLAAPRPGRIARSVTLVGRLERDPAGRGRVRAPTSGRFEVAVSPGGVVARGDTVGWIRSPETYPDSLPLTAPSAGRVLALPAGRSGLVEAWSAVATVGSTDTLRLVVPVPPDHYGDVGEGTELVLLRDGASVPVRVARFSETPGVGGRAGTRAVTRVPNPDGALQPGMRVSVELTLGDSVAGHWLPEPAVLYDRRRPDRTVVYLSGEDGYRQVPVRVARRTADSVFVSSGVESSDRVVARGAYQLLYADFSFRGIGAEAGEMEEGEEDDGGP